MTKKTLVAYKTKRGNTEETEKKIDEVLRSKFQSEIDTVDLKVQNVHYFITRQNV
jgi:menaquinone-dependent protoporphyrinogen IX oxidase